jgi:putative ribosome biogenesis GTPase RsgA
MAPLTKSALAVLQARFSQYGLSSLVDTIKNLAIDGATEDTISLQLAETPAYKTRFKANEDRIKKGLQVLSPAQYLALEDDYRQILRAYGLRQFDTDDYVTQFISNDISVTELTNRVAIATQRVQMADPAVKNTLKDFYNISENALVGYVLDPEKQFQNIERQVVAAEIGAVTGMQGIKPAKSVAEQLATQGVTKAQAQQGYATIASMLPTAEKLSDIYGRTQGEYRLGEAEQEVFNQLASAQRKRQKLAEREIATFSGASGVSKTSLTRPTGGQF